MSIENIRRFICHNCDYTTEDPDKIKWIEKLGGKCPACQDGQSKGWYAKYVHKPKKPTTYISVIIEPTKSSGLPKDWSGRTLK